MCPIRALLFLLLFHHLRALPPTLTSATSNIKPNITILGDKFTVGLYDLEFDQDLYIPTGIGYCSNVTCPDPPACPPCDYTDPNTCAGREIGTPCECPIVDCSQSHLVPILEINGPPLTFTLTPNGPSTFLLHASILNDTCSGIIIKWSNINGAITSLLAYRMVDVRRIVPATIGYPSQISSVRNSFLICPNSHLMGFTSTFSITDLISGVFPVDGYQLTLTAETFPIPVARSPSCSVPSQYQKTHRCLPSGIETTIPATGDVARFVIQPDQQCGVMQFVSSQFNLLLSTTDPWVSPQNSSGSFKTATIVQDSNYIFPGEPGVFYYCLKSGEYLFVWVDLREDLIFFIDTSEEWIQNTPFSSISAIDFPRFTLGAVTVQCPSKNFTATKYSPTYIEPFDSGSANLRLVFPGEVTNPFSSYSFFSNYEWRVSANPSLTGAFVPKKLSIALTLSQNLGKSIQPAYPIYYPLDYLYLPASEFGSCKVQLNGLIRNAQNEPIITTISTFQPKQKTCNGTRFQKVNLKIQSLISEARNLTENVLENYLDRLIAIRFTADVLLSSDAANFCRQVFRTFITLKTSTSIVKTERCLAPFNSSNFTNDPCCTSPDNQYLACKPEYRAYESQSFESFFNPIESCSSPICARDAFKRYNDEIERIKLSCSSPPQVATWKKDQQRFYWKCYTDVFGYDSKKPTPCRHDDDCPTGLCNSIHNNCIGNVTLLEQSFLRCFMKNASPFVFSAISSALKVDMSDDDILRRWWNQLQTVTSCQVKKRDLPGVHNSAAWGRAVAPMCTYCSGVVTSDVSFSQGPGGSLLWPWDCFGASLPCITGEVAVPATLSCITSLTCNYDKSLSPFNPQHCAKRGDFCGFSENERDATDLTPFNISLTSCPSTIICILANKTQIVVSSESECESAFSCDICPECNETECSEAGRCSDSTDPIYSIFSGKIFGNETAGCLIHLSYKPPFITTSDICTYPLRSTVLGCMVFPPLVNSTSCVDPNNLFGFSDIYVEKGIASWIKRATTREECEFTKACRDIPRESTQRSFYADIASVNSESECQGNFGNLWKWETSNWRRGQVRYPTVMQYGAFPTYEQVSGPALDFPRILGLMRLATSQELSLEIESAIFCEHNLKTILLAQMVCSCISEKDDGSTCFARSNQSTETKLEVACGGRASTLESPPLSVQLQTTSVSQNLCYSVAISNLPLSTYAPKPSSLLTLLLIQSSFDYSYSITNQDGEVYGKLLTDGFILLARSPNQTLKDVRVCISIPNRPLNDGRLPVLDIAILARNGSFTPQEADVTFEDDRYCTNLSSVINGKSYFFIERTEGDWNYPPRLDFTSGEIAFISVILLLYVIGLLFATTLLVRHVIVNFVVDRMLFIICVMEAFYICRIILFSLALSDSDSVLQEHAVGYLLVELPILLFFCFVSFFVIAWGLILWANRDISVSQSNFFAVVNKIAIFFNSIIFGLFLLMIILFQTVVASPYFICENTQVVFDSYSAHALALSYRIIFSTVAIVLGLGLLIVGGLMLKLASEYNLGISTKTVIQVAVATLVGTFGLLGQAIYYLIIAGVEKQQPLYVTLSILLVDEVIPALVFTSLAITTNPRSEGLKGFVTRIASNPSLKRNQKDEQMDQQAAQANPKKPQKDPPNALEEETEA